MEIATVNALFRYFEELYGLNQNVIALCGINVFDITDKHERRMDEVMITIPRLVPYKLVRNTDKIILIKSDGLMSFADEIPFIGTDYKNILQKHNDFLVKAKKIRNKLEHQVHNANIVGLGSNPSWFSVTYKVKDTEIDFRSYELISFVKDLNVLFSKIQAEVIQCLEEHQKVEYRYYTRITRFDFCDFNKIYESNISDIIGKLMLPF